MAFQIHNNIDRVRRHLSNYAIKRLQWQKKCKKIELMGTKVNQLEN